MGEGWGWETILRINRDRRRLGAAAGSGVAGAGGLVGGFVLGMSRVSRCWGEGGD